MQIRTSAEDYLETILLLSKKGGAVRSIDIANDTGFSKPSVSIAMKKLRDSEMIVMDGGGRITLTKKGGRAARQVYERHSAIYDWLVSIGVSDKIAAMDACRMEHLLSDETFEAIKRQLERGAKAPKMPPPKKSLIKIPSPKKPPSGKSSPPKPPTSKGWKKF
jgi:Mn-dependent DtxR family transcriptional regulator